MCNESTTCYGKNQMLWVWTVQRHSQPMPSWLLSSFLYSVSVSFMERGIRTSRMTIHKSVSNSWMVAFLHMHINHTGKGNSWDCNLQMQANLQIYNVIIRAYKVQPFLIGVKPGVQCYNIIASVWPLNLYSYNFKGSYQSAGSHDQQLCLKPTRCACSHQPHKARGLVTFFCNPAGSASLLTAQHNAQWLVGATVREHGFTGLTHSTPNRTFATITPAHWELISHEENAVVQSIQLLTLPLKSYQQLIPNLKTLAL